jgi:thioredoxin reductase (NADPH)
MSDDMKYDLIVIGGGPSGMTAAMYGARYGLKILLLESGVLGGAQATSPIIENYPGFLYIVGIELATKMKEQVKKSGAIIQEITEVKEIRKEGEIGHFYLDTRRGEYQAQAVIIATGGGHRKLNVPGEEELTGRGVSYCATCDGPLFRGKDLAVIGGGNTAVTEALYLSELASSVKLIHRRDELRAEHAMQQMIFKSNVEIIWDTVVTEFKGDDLIQELILENVKTKEKQSLRVDGAFVALGSQPNSSIVESMGVELNNRKEIITDREQKTNIPGLFAVGDVVDSMKQIAVAVGHGAIAADSAYKYIRGVGLGPR